MLSRTARWRDFYELTKPRMNMLVVLTMLAGFYFAGGRGGGALEAVLGTALTAAGASVLNQWMERHLDGLMPRTRLRPLPAGRVLPSEALAWGLLLCAAGVAYLSLRVNVLTALLGLLTLLTYLLWYTPSKRRTSLCTLIGAIPGAIPPLMGWTAARGILEAGAWPLFAILFFWQIPHFLAIAVMYRQDYAAGGFRMLPLVQPEQTGRQTVWHTQATFLASLMPLWLGQAGWLYALWALLLGVVFLAAALRFLHRQNQASARRLFFTSIIYLPLLLGGLVPASWW